MLLQELTLSPYFCVNPDVPNALERFGEGLHNGPTANLARSLATEHGIAVQASLYERTVDECGFNTSICVGSDGAILSQTLGQPAP